MVIKKAWGQSHSMPGTGWSWAWSGSPSSSSFPCCLVSPLTLSTPDEDLLRRVAEGPLPCTVGTGHTEPHGHADGQVSHIVVTVRDARTHGVPDRLPCRQHRARG